MENEIIEETIENPEEETSDEVEEIKEETETPEKPISQKEEHTDKEKRLYARMKKAEEKAKLAEEALAKKPTSDLDVILDVQRATVGLDASEVTELKNRAAMVGGSLSEARKDENFVIWQKGYKEKVEQDNAPDPSTEQGIAEGKKALKDMTLDEKNDYLVKQGFIKGFPKVKPL